jgi:hypothetical protein
MWTKLEEAIRTGQGQGTMICQENSASFQRGSRRYRQRQPELFRPPMTFAVIVACSTSVVAPGHGSLPSYSTIPRLRERCLTCRTPPP